MEKNYCFHGTTVDKRRFSIALNLENKTFGVSICAPNDQFVKKVGFVKAQGRSKAKNAPVISKVVGENNINDFMENPGKGITMLGEKLSGLKAGELVKITQ